MTGNECYAPEIKPIDRASGMWPIVAVFIVFSCSVAYQDTWNYVVKGLGVILLLSFLTRSVSARVSVMPELYCYASLICWSVTAVLFSSPNSPIFWAKFTTMVQICIMALIIASFSFPGKALSINLLAFLVAACIVSGYSILTGENLAAEGGARAASLTGINGFGYLMMLETIAIAYFWMLPTRGKWVKRIILVCLMLVSMQSAFSSGSRKSVMGLALFYVLWVWFCYRKELLRRPLMIVGIFVMGAVLFVGARYFMSRTSSSDRFERTVDLFHGEATKGGGEERLELYKEGFRVLKTSPIVGVGLDNFVLHNSMALMTHSDFMEILVDTGIPGLLLYGGIYVFLWRRAGKIAKLTQERDLVQFRIARLIRAALVVIVLTSLGRPNYDSKETWVLLSCFIGYSFQLYKRLEKDRFLAEYPAEPALEMSGK